MKKPRLSGEETYPRSPRPGMVSPGPPLLQNPVVITPFCIVNSFDWKRKPKSRKGLPGSAEAHLKAGERTRNLTHGLAATDALKICYQSLKILKTAGILDQGHDILWGQMVWGGGSSGNEDPSTKEHTGVQRLVARCIEPSSCNYISHRVICIWVMNVCIFGSDCPIYIWNLLNYY